MSLTVAGQTWEDASSPAALQLSRRFEAAWRDACARSARLPLPENFLHAGAAAGSGAGTLLALLRSELGLRREAGERPVLESYLARYPNLSEEAYTALIYEEFCLREEAGEAPDAEEYLARFGAVSSRLRRVFDIHRLMGRDETTVSFGPRAASTTPFPAVGQTIAGFGLVEELGRGAFGRVFLARERELADRLVALKVTRAGSREPRTLARLQHTHIVPVYSYRTDPTTGLHLLCMPFFGRVTLARLLAEPRVKTARAGHEVLATLDAMCGADTGVEPGLEAAEGRRELARRDFARALAWWGARMAEALAHAHQRGVLHRDVKPSNVLVTPDGMPMLLDFNLARERVLDPGDDAVLGGTLDYMAPEHIDALARGVGDDVDARADIYGLGVLLYEALTNARPFETPRQGLSIAEVLSRAAGERRHGPPCLRATHPEIPAALEAVIRRCLEPDPARRYNSAGDLAHDLDAVADDQPLKFANEPILSRAGRRLRRNRRPLAMTILAALAGAGLITAGVRDRLELDQRRGEASKLIEEGGASIEHGDYVTALAQFDSASRLAAHRRRMSDLSVAARGLYHSTKAMKQARDDANALFATAEPLRFRLAGFGGDLATAERTLARVLAPFHVLTRDDWTTLPDMALLDPSVRDRLVREVNELLYLNAFALATRGLGDADFAAVGANGGGAAPSAKLDDALLRREDDLRRAGELSRRALWFATPVEPWARLARRLRVPRVDEILAERARRERFATALPEHSKPVAPSTADLALASFEEGLLSALEKDRPRAIDAFEAAARREPGRYWYHFYLAYQHELEGRLNSAWEHYSEAFVLRPNSPWVRFCRARIERARGDLAEAEADFTSAIDDFTHLDEGARDRESELQSWLELGLVRQKRGRWAAARDAYARVALAPNSPQARAARLNEAQIDVATGAHAEALTHYGALLAERPGDRLARLGRAMLLMSTGRTGDALVDLDTLVRDRRASAVRNERGAREALAEVLTYRAQALLTLGRAQAGWDDIDAAARLQFTPERGRLRLRAELAAGRYDTLDLTRPDAVRDLPIAGPTLADDLEKGVARLDAMSQANGPEGFRALLNRAVLLTALGRSNAPAEARRALVIAPFSVRARLVHAWALFWAGALDDAARAVNDALPLAPEDVELLELRGRLRLAAGNASEAIADLDRAVRDGNASASARAARAETLMTLGRDSEAVLEWTRILLRDPVNAEALHNRARARIARGQIDAALGDLDQASAWATPGSGLPTRLLATYALCFSSRPRRCLGRLPTLANQVAADLALRAASTPAALKARRIAARRDQQSSSPPKSGTTQRD